MAPYHDDQKVLSRTNPAGQIDDSPLRPDEQKTVLEPYFTSSFAVSRMLSLSSLKPTSYAPRYPRWMVGRPLLVATSALASLGDAMFGYSQGIIAANQVQPSFIKRMFGKEVTMEQVQTSTTGVNPFVAGA